MGVALAVEFLFGEFMLELADLVEYTFVFAIFDGGEDGIVHNFDEDTVLPEDLALLKGKNNNSGVFDGLDDRDEEVLDIVQIDKLLGQHLIHRQFQPVELSPGHSHQHIDIVHHIFAVKLRLHH